tara:strand:- start:227 stop:517 length:291 start_codon:yes stop_codon:yes gene_type:complete
MNKAKRVEAIKQEFTEKRTKKLNRFHELKEQIKACQEVIDELVPQLIKSGHARYIEVNGEYWITKDQLQKLPVDWQKRAGMFRVKKTIKRLEVDKV